VDLLAKELYNLAAGEQDGGGSSDEDSEEEEWGAGLEREGGGRSGPEGRRRRRGGEALTQPYEVFLGLMLDDLRELHDDIKGFKVGFMAVAVCGNACLVAEVVLVMVYR
jgi:hypothetical protein